MCFNLKVCELILPVVRILLSVTGLQLQCDYKRNFRASNGICLLFARNYAKTLPCVQGRFLTYSHGRLLPCGQGCFMSYPHGTSVRIASTHYIRYTRIIIDSYMRLLGGRNMCRYSHETLGRPHGPQEV